MGVLENKKAIVTGGALGIGLATASRLLDEGCDVTILGYEPGRVDSSGGNIKILETGHGLRLSM